MEKLSEEIVHHVAHLARIEISPDKCAQYQVELKRLWDEVEKIKEVKGYDEDFMIAPFDQEARLREDQIGKMSSPEEILKNVPRKNGHFVEVPVVIHD